MRRFALAGLLVAALAAPVFANGRAPGTSTIHFQEGHEEYIAAGMTFGLLLSHDSGATWHWMCETAVGYGGLWDPDYSYMNNGTLFATTFKGLTSNTDGCTFATTSFGDLFVSSDEGKGSSFLFAAADTNAKDEKILLLYMSADGGATFTQMSTVGLPTMPASQSSIDIVGVDPTNPSIVYARITYATGTMGDTIYKTINAGQSWTTIASKTDTIAFLARSNGDLVIGTKFLGAEVSTNGGTTWTPLTNPPRINCLAENSAHEVWACTQNFDVMTGSGSDTVPGDGYGIMKTTDLATWTGVLKYQDIAGPVECPAGTKQQDMCVGSGNWCGLRTQLGITGSGGVECSVPTDAGLVHVTPPKGCCDSGTGSAPPLAMGIVLAFGFARRRRKNAA